MKFLTSSTIGVQIFFLISFVGTVFGIYTYHINLNSLLLIILGYFCYGCLGIVVTFHRGLTHSSYSSNLIIRKFFSILGCLGGTGSPLAWAAIHINHHLKSDTPEDPHSPLYKGINIFSLNYESDIDLKTKWKMKELIKNKFYQNLHRYYFMILASWSLLLYLIGGFYLMIFLHWAPALLTAVMSNIVNYIGHTPESLGGSRRYRLSDRSSNNWIWAIPSWGESWHNNHHRYPKNYSFSQKWWEIDISGLIIKIIKK